MSSSPTATDDSDSDENTFVVEKILDDKKIKGKKYYLLKWEGFPDSENSWEPDWTLNCPEILKEYLDMKEKKAKKKKAQTLAKKKSKKGKNIKKQQNKTKPKTKDIKDASFVPYKEESLSDSSFLDISSDLSSEVTFTKKKNITKNRIARIQNLDDFVVSSSSSTQEERLPIYQDINPFLLRVDAPYLQYEDYRSDFADLISPLADDTRRTDYYYNNEYDQYDDIYSDDDRSSSKESESLELEEGEILSIEFDRNFPLPKRINYPDIPDPDADTDLVRVLSCFDMTDGEIGYNVITRKKHVVKLTRKQLMSRRPKILHIFYRNLFDARFNGGWLPLVDKSRK